MRYEPEFKEICSFATCHEHKQRRPDDPGPQEGGQTIVILHNQSVKLVERLNVANVGTLALRIVAQTASSVSRPAEMSPDRTSSVGVHAGPACEEKRALGNNVRLWCHFSKSTSVVVVVSHLQLLSRVVVAAVTEAPVRRGVELYRQGAGRPAGSWSCLNPSVL